LTGINVLRIDAGNRVLHRLGEGEGGAGLRSIELRGRRDEIGVLGEFGGCIVQGARSALIRPANSFAIKHLRLVAPVRAFSLPILQRN
jgi:hypothetical protein